MRIDLIEMRSIHIASPEHQRRRDVPLITKEHSLQQRARRDQAGLSIARIHPQQFHLTRNEFRRLFGIGGGTRAAAVNVGCDVMNLFAIFVGDGGVVRGTGVGAEDDAVFVDEADDGGSGFGGEGEDGFFGVGGGGGGLRVGGILDEGIAVDVVEVEASRGGVGVDSDGRICKFGHDCIRLYIRVKDCLVDRSSNYKYLY
mmetsp:Transcript_11888/g.20650  ORF Transcript_11888/g.20650 Transcript_11888/m.20650 type:complete len:200 (+) Transcript_11888:589-1188(+)